MITAVEHFKNPIIDQKIKGRSWMIQLKIGDYLSIVNKDGNIFQRSILQKSFYKTLIRDLLDDTSIPPISVVYTAPNWNIADGFTNEADFIILDGLQRTQCLLECLEILKNKKSDGIIKTETEFLDKTIYIEVWENIDLRNILYKMVVLNTGQKKMDYSHQLDILNLSLLDKLREQGINVITSKSTKEGEEVGDGFLLADVSEALVSYINRSPISGKKSAAEFLFERIILTGDAESIEISTIYNQNTYDNLFWILRDFNDAMQAKYGDKNPMRRHNPFIVSFAASLGYATIKNAAHFIEKRDALITMLKSDEADPLNIDRYDVLYSKFKTSIGDKRRRLIFEAFRSYFSTPYINTIEWLETYERLYGEIS